MRFKALRCLCRRIEGEGAHACDRQTEGTAGAKSVLSVASDFANALPRLKVGGIVVTDDLPINPVLRRIWERVIVRDGRYSSWEFIDANVGVAAAIRVADAAPVVLALPNT